MYKVTVGDKTMVGTNFDAYYLTPRIWFENAANAYTYGAAFSGGRIDGVNGYAPQSGMNEFGLSFSRLAAPTPEKNMVDMSGKKPITNPNFYLKDILHTCKTTAEVQNYINKYNHSYFQQDVFIYIDKSGKYLIVEPYTTTIGNDAKYVLSNFCPSVTDDAYRNKLARYHNGAAFLKDKIDTTVGFCTALSDTMHVCRENLGDGTLLTSLWDLRSGIISLYFYHDYKNIVQFNLKDELAKGDHFLQISKLFPPNAEFQKLCNIITPQTNQSMNMLLVLCAVVLLFSALFFFITYFIKRNSNKYSFIKLIVVILNIILAFYIFILNMNIAIFYSSAPFQDYKFTILTVAAYIPFLLLFLIIPLLRINVKVFRENSWRFISKWLFAITNLTYLILLILFTYWRLFNVL
jgi:hypothetical protein